MIKNKLFAFFTLIPILSMNMEKSSNPLTICAIPGQNGLGSSNQYINTIFNEQHPSIVRVETPEFPCIDLGQSRCISRLRETLTLHKDKKNIVIHATSQGTGTALNYLASEDTDQQIGALILEAPLASGNSAILHTCKGRLMEGVPFIQTIAHLPFSYYWLPYLSKALFPLYWPGGKQPIKTAANQNRDVPIIILHSKDDPQLAFTDACALYYGLKSKGNKNVYFLPKKALSICVFCMGKNKNLKRSILF